MEGLRQCRFFSPGTLAQFAGIKRALTFSVEATVIVVFLIKHPRPQGRAKLIKLALACGPSFMAMIFSSGCNLSKSRYAMKDPVYAQKYAEGAQKGELLQKAKQANDARHVAGMSGWTIGGATAYRPKSDNTLGGFEVGVERYPTSYFSQRIGVVGYASQEEGYLGVDTGIRLQTPTRLAPFVGAGGLIGASRGISTAPDGVDNDEDDQIDEPGVESSNIDHFFLAVYPEVGGHFWLTERLRASVYSRYMFTNLSREHDDWMIGGQFTFFPARPSFK